jgi:hypothetical protein
MLASGIGTGTGTNKNLDFYGKKRRMKLRNEEKMENRNCKVCDFLSA